MDDLLIKKITLISAIIASLFINIDFHLFFLFKIDDVQEILEEQSWKNSIKFSKRREGSTYELKNNLPAIVILESKHFSTPQSMIWIDIRSSEEIMDVSTDIYDLSLEQKDQGSIYEYSLGINNLIDGTNEFEIEIEDQYGYKCSRNISVEVDTAQVLGASTEREEIVLSSGDDLTVLIDSKYALSYDYAPSDLVSLSDYAVSCLNGDKRLREIAATDLKNLMDAALADGVYLYVLSAYRSFDHQLDLYNFIYKRDGEAFASKSAALPGHSEHQLGTAVDFTSDQMIHGTIRNFSYTEASRWLALHAYEYGFVLSFPADYTGVTGIKYEPWHYRYVGVENAEKIRKSGKIPIEYLKELNSYYEEDSN